MERFATRLLDRPTLQLPVDDDPGACSVPRGGGWRPGARWAREGMQTRADVEAQIATLPTHAQPPMRELGRRSEAASHPYKATTPAPRVSIPAAKPVEHAPLALIGKIGRREEVVAACDGARALGVHPGMAATHARALVSDLDFRPAEPEADAALLDRLALLAVRRWSPIAAVSPSDGLWIDLAGCEHLHGGEERFCRRLVAFCRRAGFTARVAVADTLGAAHALARYGRGDLIRAEPGTTASALAPLPIVALRLAPNALSAARRFGFETVADLLPVARGPLARRLGLPAITRLDQALGAVAEPITPCEDAEVPLVERRLLEPIGTAEAIEQVMGDLLRDLAGVLQERGLGARALRLFASSTGMARPCRGDLATRHEESARMKLIGIEEHYLTPGVRDAWEVVGLANYDPSVAVHSGEVERRLLDLADERLALMDETGLDVQVLSLTTPALHDLGQESVDLARRANDAVAHATSRCPERFQALAALPVTVPQEAALELERCVRTLGFKGAMLCGRVGDRNLDHPDLRPVFESAATLGVPILLHPRTPAAAIRSAYYSGFTPAVDAAFAMYGLGWHYDAGIQFIRLVLAGTFDRLPDLQVILGHWGEVVLFYAERLAAMDRVSGLTHPIASYLRRNLYVTASGMFSPGYLARAAAIVGTDRLLFSTDYPYQYRDGGDARRFLAECGLDGLHKAAFAHGNWDRLTGARRSDRLEVQRP